MTSDYLLRSKSDVTKHFKSSWRKPSHNRLQIHGSEEVGPKEYGEALALLGCKTDEPISVYVHLPFCPVRCLYCGCRTIITHDSNQIDLYLDGLEKEIDMVIDKIGLNRVLLQLHFGGGTPNYLNDSQLIRLMSIIKNRFRIIGETDTSIECNPRKTSSSQLNLLYSLGFKHISLGVQDFNPSVQKAIGRINSKELVKDTCTMAREAGFESVNIDLIYGLPHQNLEYFRSTIESTIDLAPDRISCYAYSHDPVNNPHQHAIDMDHLPTHKKSKSLFEQAVYVFSESGYSWIGLESFSLDTDDLAIAKDEQRLFRNCIGYTEHQSSYCISLGIGAISDLDGIIFQNEPHTTEWLNAINDLKHPVSFGYQLTAKQKFRRSAFMQLICNLQLSSSTAKLALPDEYAFLDNFVDLGLIELVNNVIYLTNRGRFHLHDRCLDPYDTLSVDSSLWPLLEKIQQ